MPHSDPTPPNLRRSISLLGACAVSIGIIIGSGIFRTPPSIAKELASPATILILWALGGLLSLFGAFTYSELAVMYPQSGGTYVFIREGFGRCAAFVFGWTYMLISKPLAAAGIAIIFAEHLNALLGTDWDERLATIGMLIILTLINIRGVALSASVAVFLTALKLFAIVGIVIAALVLQKGDTANFHAALPQGGTPKPLLDAFIPVMFAILWTYDGWSDVGAIAGEVKNPSRNLPLAYLISTLIVTGLYLAVNAVYIWLVPLPEMAQTDTLARVVMGKLMGDGGATAVTLIVLISTLGSTHGSILTGARISYAQARDGLLFRSLGHVHPRWFTPDVSLIAQLILSCAATWFVGTFEKLAGGFVFTMWIFYGLAAAAIFVLRIKRPDAPRPVRCWGYPVVPALFILAALAMTVLSIRGDPWGTLPWVGVLLAGVPIYYLWTWLVPPTAAVFHKESFCPHCGYSLTGLPGTSCPECGKDTTIVPSEPGG